MRKAAAQHARQHQAPTSSQPQHKDHKKKQKQLAAAAPPVLPPAAAAAAALPVLMQATLAAMAANAGGNKMSTPPVAAAAVAAAAAAAAAGVMPPFVPPTGERPDNVAHGCSEFQAGCIMTLLLCPFRTQMVWCYADLISTWPLVSIRPFVVPRTYVSQLLMKLSSALTTVRPLAPG